MATRSITLFDIISTSCFITVAAILMSSCNVAHAKGEAKDAAQDARPINQPRPACTLIRANIEECLGE